ncbi:DMT family transporter [Aequitasia blattaphilus]|uniref:DMT family transporter n=1 Tax=Aequitasia blattaphilus TaxID=2949332 RepID=A0ABT1EAY2_9FIRM|nr:DMT family transporter [Aequitasia blattaphilus]MCP1102991.1 DMT family transporter [Aequitasia blattaphilus]MCR8615631.1 DMT family transporter [Aequitasia blattaphilus]
MILQYSNTMKKENIGYLNVFITGSIWGTLGIFVKLMESYGSTAAVTSFVRVSLATLLLAIVTLIKEGPKGFKISRKTLISCILLGTICQGIYNILFSTSVSKNGMSIASVLLYTAPVFTCIASVLLFKEKLNKRKMVALFINIFGCILTATGGNLSSTNLAFTGILAGIGTGFCFGLQPVFGRLATDEGSPFAVATYNFLFATITVAFITKPWNLTASSFNKEIMGIGFLYALIPTTIGYLIYYNGLGKIKESSKVSIITSIELVLANIFGFLLFGESVGFFHILGILCVLSSIVINNDLLKSRRKV